jgi:hypothetical protein
MRSNKRMKPADPRVTSLTGRRNRSVAGPAASGATITPDGRWLSSTPMTRSGLMTAREHSR